MFQLTLTLIAFALCALHSHVAYVYGAVFPSPSRSHEASYTSNEDAISPGNLISSDSIPQRSFFFDHHPSPSSSATPVPSYLSAIINSPTPSQFFPYVSTNDNILSNGTASKSSQVSPAGSVPQTNADESNTDNSSIFFASSRPESTPIQSSSSPFMERIIASLHRSSKGQPRHRQELSQTPLFSLIDDNQQSGLLDPTVDEPLPSSSVSVIERYNTRDRPESESTESRADEAAPSPIGTLARRIADISRRDAMRYSETISTSTRTSTPLPPALKGFERQNGNARFDVRFQESVHASGLQRPTTTPPAFRERITVGNYFHVATPDSVLEDSVQDSPPPSDSLDIQKYVKTEILRRTVTPSPASPRNDGEAAYQHLLDHRKTRQLSSTLNDIILRTKRSISSISSRMNGPSLPLFANARKGGATFLEIESSASPLLTSSEDLTQDTGRITMEAMASNIPVANTVAPSDEEDYCESVKQCMCATIQRNLLSPTLISYCNDLDELTASVCEQSREAHIFFEFFRKAEGVEGFALVNECAPDIVDLW